MTNFKEIIIKNPDVDFVVHITNKQQLDELVSVMEELGFEYAVPLGTIAEMAERFAAEDGYDGCCLSPYVARHPCRALGATAQTSCLRLSRQRGVAYNPSVEHWRYFTNDIVELRNGKIVFHEGYPSREDAELEKSKLRKAFADPSEGEFNRRLFGLENSSADEIEQWLAEKVAPFPEEYSRIYE